MNTERLYEFLVLSHVLNYTRAAKALYISQPILTRHIQALEAELVVPLFRRTTHGVTLTEAGRLLSNQAKACLRSATGRSASCVSATCPSRAASG